MVEKIVAQISPIVAQKVVLKREGFRNSQKRCFMFGQLLLEEFVTKTFKK